MPSKLFKKFAITLRAVACQSHGVDVGGASCALPEACWLGGTHFAS